MLTQSVIKGESTDQLLLIVFVLVKTVLVTLKWRHCLCPEVSREGKASLEEGRIREAKIAKEDDATDQLWNALILASPLQT